jgi:hypothetical protein
VSKTRDFPVLIKLLPTLRVFPDALGWTTLTSEEAHEIRKLGFLAHEGRWRLPVLPPELTFDTPFESLSVEWYRRNRPQLVTISAKTQEREIQVGLPAEAAVKGGESAITSDSDPKPLVCEQERYPRAEVPGVAPRIFRARHDRSKAIAKRQFREKLRRLPPAVPGQALPVFPDWAWERLRYKGKKFRKWLENRRAFRPCPFFQEFQNLSWTKFKQFGVPDSDLFPWLIWLTEPQYPGMFDRRRLRRPKGSDPFEDMPEPLQSKARVIFARLCNHWGWNLPSWRKAILAGRARRLATHPPDSKWGRSMRAKRGGYAVQEKYRQQGHHPLGLVVPDKSQALTKRP